jgi:hypothetical protein
MSMPRPAAQIARDLIEARSTPARDTERNRET